MNDKYSPPLFVKDDTTILTNLKKGEANARYAFWQSVTRWDSMMIRQTLSAHIWKMCMR